MIAQPLPPKLHRRGGVTLLEVMFAIGVVVIGLLGVIALLPVAAHQAQKGMLADRAGTLAKSMSNEFHARGMAYPNNWARWHASGQEFRQFNPLDPPRQNNDPPNNVPFHPLEADPLIPQSFAIDPRFVAEPDNWGPGGNRFPYGTDDGTLPVNDDSILRMPRITLWSALPNNISQANLQQPAMQARIRLMANELFVSQDDLAFDLPDDRTLDPIQVFDDDDNKRLADGNLSWMATLVPQRNGGYYRLSIVVFNRRDGSMARDEVNERVVNVAEFYGGGIGMAGGDVRLEARDDTRPAEELDLQTGDWMMLARRIGPPGGRYDVFQWYRVAATDDEPQQNANGVWTRDVSLYGPNWDYATSAQATLMPGVVTVYEKPVRLEINSLWTR